ncbi:MAG TPA: ABC transporter ATP-binding protein [Thermoanaerobaculia bacterium]|nr:ABC transporter ATP-binding protein [Thermoanaerobaculia bacterium]
MTIEVRAVGYRYRARLALGSVTTTFPDQQLVALVGPNGSGKSTLLKLLARVLRPVSGEVLFHGRNLEEWAPKEYARSVSYLPQEPSPAFPMKAIDVVLSGRSPFLGRFQWEGAQDLGLARDALRKCDALEFADRYIDSLSGGEKQRVFLARVFVASPAVILLDEPLTGLDVAHVQTFMELLRSFVDSTGVTAILVSHELNWCSAYADRMIVMRGGSIALDGPPREVMTESAMRELFGFDAKALHSEEATWIVPRVSARKPGSNR